MQMLWLYIDLDDVLCDTAGAYLRLIKQEFNLDIAFEDVFSFDLKRSFGLSDEQNKHMFKLAHSKEFVLELEVIDGVQKILVDLHNKGIKLAIVTGRHTSAYLSTQQWLDSQAIPFDSLVMVDKYGWPETNPAIAVSLDQLDLTRYTMCIEDNPDMVAYLSDIHGKQVLLFDRPWNREIQESQQVRRFSSWKELPSLISSTKLIIP
ncbi:MAG: HAD hydrolase-like protein [Desulfocapsaceae bacterium]|nr:HAD hydrolase-like protein [Desulfocapsaceae bacterium]